MRINDTYNIWQSISFIHPYYEGRQIPVRLVPDKSTQQLINKYRLVFRRTEMNTWSILTPINGTDTNSMHPLCFHLQPTSPVFYYVSEQLLPSRDIGVETTTTPKSWLTFTIRLSATSQKHSITIPAKSYYWEFLLFLPGKQDEEVLTIYEKNNRIPFGKAEKVAWPTHPHVISIRSTETIGTDIKDLYTIRLKEEKQGRERILCESLPPPLPDRLSPTGQQNTITTYFYL